MEQSNMGRNSSQDLVRMSNKIFLLVSVIALTSDATQRPDYDDTPNPEFLNPFWMAGIPNNQSLSEVTMPGTHNTMALYGGIYAMCQSWNLSTQLLAGVRFLDIRLRHDKGNLNLHHGITYQQGHFGHVLQGICKFLSMFPSETVLMRVREELSTTNNIYNAVVKYINRYVYLCQLWRSRQVPTMGEARGKLILLQDFVGPQLGLHYNFLDIADKWKVPTIMQIGEKWKSVYTHLEAAAAGSRWRIFLTFTSGAGILAYPKAVARRINQRLYDYLKAKSNLNQRFGIICMDFPAAPIIQLIIDFQLREVERRKRLTRFLESQV